MFVPVSCVSCDCVHDKLQRSFYFHFLYPWARLHVDNRVDMYAWEEDTIMSLVDAIINALV